MKKYTRLLTVFIAIFILGTFIPTTAFANSAEPPCLTILITNASVEPEISVRLADGKELSASALTSERKGWELYYRLYYNGSPFSLDGAALIVNTSENSFECPLPSDTYSEYNNLITLDVKNKTITVGQPAYRTPLLILMRVVLTLIIEGLIFFAFKIWDKKSWIAFFVINLITQGALNIFIVGPNLASYWYFGFVLAEILIFIIEAVAFAFTVEDFKNCNKGHAVLYSLLANAASLIVGGFLISKLPV